MSTAALAYTTTRTAKNIADKNLSILRTVMQERIESTDADRTAVLKASGPVDNDHCLMVDTTMGS
jgi:hypothetical protein